MTSRLHGEPQWEIIGWTKSDDRSGQMAKCETLVSQTSEAISNHRFGSQEVRTG